MSARSLGLLATATFALGACHTGPSAERFAAAVGPHGVQVRLEARRGNVDGELLEVRDTAFVVLTRRAVLLVPFSAVRAADFEHVGWYDSARDERTLREWRALSRYPGGMPDEALRHLLASRRQTEIRAYRR